MKRTWVVGSLNVDLVIQVDRFPLPGETLQGNEFSTFLGGKGGNQAMALSRLGAGPSMVGAVGDDQFGGRYREALAAEGADICAIRIVPDVSTGTALIEVDRSGQNRIVIVAGANGTNDVDATAAAVQAVAPGDLVLFQLEIPHATVWETIKTVHEGGAITILDPAPAAPIPEDVLPHVDWITPNEHEASIITGVATDTDEGLKEAARRLVAAGVTHAVVKAGARGAYLALGPAARAGMSGPAASGEPVLVPGFPVTAVDTTAAGDSFNGGLAWALASGLDPHEAVRQGNAVAALSVTGFGAQTAMPTADAVREFLGNI
jgi:ribokinase